MLNSMVINVFSNLNYYLILILLPQFRFVSIFAGTQSFPSCSSSLRKDSELEKTNFYICNGNERPLLDSWGPREKNVVLTHPVDVRLLMNTMHTKGKIEFKCPAQITAWLKSCLEVITVENIKKKKKNTYEGKAANLE